MTDRVRKLYEKRNNCHVYPICVERLQIITDSFKAHEGWPTILKRAQAVADYLDKRTIFIEDDELLIYNLASKPMGMEMRPSTATWEDEDFDKLLADGLMTITDEERKIAHSYDDYYWQKGRTVDEMRAMYYDEERMFPFVKRGVIVPPWTPSCQRGGAGEGWCLKFTGALMTPDWEYQLKLGFENYLEMARQKLKDLRIRHKEDIESANFLKATIIAMEACIRLGYRYADLAAKKASECQDPVRKKELEEIAEICRRVPAKPARTFREAMQAWMFFYYLTASAAEGFGRMDQYLYPYYKADLDAGRITRDEALELLELFRLKVMQYGSVFGGAFQREKWAGMARWNNIILGGTDPATGEDATNDLTFMFLEAAKEVRTAHPTMTLRVHKGSPKEILDAAVDLVSTGIGMPAFISEDSYIDFIVRRGIPVEEARKFAIAGCLDITMPGRARMNTVSMFVVPIVMEFAMNNGQNYRTGEQIGPQTGYLRDFRTYEEFYDAFMKQMDYFMGMYAEYGAIKMVADMNFPDVYNDAFFPDSIKECRDVLSMRQYLENGISFNVVGMANAINSLAGLKKVVFDEKKATPAEMHEALLKNWKGAEELQRACLDAPKYGNNNDYVDSIGEKLWIDLREIAESHKSIWDEPLYTSGISITAHAPGGKLCGATPDGRFDGETLADGSTSPVQGTDKSGPLAVLQSGMRMAKGWSVSLMNMKFTPSALKTPEDRSKLGAMIKTYLTNGGKHIQFNVVDRATLEAAQKDHETYKNLIVRVAGYSAYFVELTDRIQKEVMDRTEHVL